jgi:hypothetical protein
MVHPPMPRFPHRFNKNGSYESICAECQMTIASARVESELAYYEVDHVCNPIRLFQLGRYQNVADAVALRR